MKKSLVIIGIVLVVLGIVPLLVFLVVPSMMRSIDQAPALKNFLQPVMCQASETLSSKQQITHEDGGNDFNAYFSCVNARGQARDVTSTSWLYGIGGFVVPLLLGIVLISVGARKPKRVVQSAAAQMSNWQGYAQLPQADFGGASMSEVRLNALKTALDAGYITQAQYEVQCEAILRQG